jgi:adenosylhomocysteine nucleosidase
MLALMAALREEITDLLRAIDVEEAFSEGESCLYKGKYSQRDILLVQSGPGKERAERAAAYLLDHFSVVPLLSIGFAGALSPEPKVGDVVLCRHLYCSNGDGVGDSRLESRCSSDIGLVSLSRDLVGQAAGKLLEGDSVTVRRLIGEPAIKERLGKAFSALAVDMESYWIARIASSKGIPFLAVRAISDSMEEGLPPMERFTDSRLAWRWEKAMPYFLFYPLEIKRLIGLYHNARQARRNLTAFVDLFLSHSGAG